MAIVDVVIAATSREWATLLTAWITDHGEQVRLCDHYVFDRADALEQPYDCLVVDAGSSLLDPALIQQLRRRDRTVIGVADPDVPDSRARLREFGVDHVLAATDYPQAMLAAILEAVQADRRFRETVTDLDPLTGDDDDGPPLDTAAASRHGPAASVLTVVTGALEGVGATEVAIEAAACLRARGESCVLVDADLVAPTLAQRLQTPLTANLYAAIDAVTHRLIDLSRVLTVVDRGGFEVLAGVEHPKHWQHLDVDDVLAVLEALLASRQHVIACVGSQLEALPSGRHELVRTLVRTADRVVVVAEPSPTGLVQLSRWMVDAIELTELGRVHVILNRSDRRDARAQVDAELLRTVPCCAGVHHVPSDRRVAAAHWGGTLVPTGRFTKAVAAAVDAAIPRAAGASTRPGARS